MSREMPRGRCTRRDVHGQRFPGQMICPGGRCPEEMSQGEMPRGDDLSRERCPEEMSQGEMRRGDDLSRGKCPEEMSRGEMPRGDDLSRGRCPGEMFYIEMRRGDDLSRGDVPGRDAQGRLFVRGEMSMGRCH